MCGGYPDALGRCAQLLDESLSADFVDVNMGGWVCMCVYECGLGAWGGRGRGLEAYRAVGKATSISC